MSITSRMRVRVQKGARTPLRQTGRESQLAIANAETYLRAQAVCAPKSVHAREGKVFAQSMHLGHVYWRIGACASARGMRGWPAEGVP